MKLWEAVTKSANKFNHPNQNPSFSSRVPPYTWQYLNIVTNATKHDVMILTTQFSAYRLWNPENANCKRCRWTVAYVFQTPIGNGTFLHAAVAWVYQHKRLYNLMFLLSLILYIHVCSSHTSVHLSPLLQLYFFPYSSYCLFSTIFFMFFSVSLLPFRYVFLPILQLVARKKLM
jgi:hypothetical protein